MNKNHTSSRGSEATAAICLSVVGQIVAFNPVFLSDVFRERFDYFESNAYYCRGGPLCPPWVTTGGYPYSDMVLTILSNFVAKNQ